ncbi:MAG: fasciclin domain-containing protein [Planctomycetota bacterium]|jgi:uncharacterized surface protein with fasciclin (FAS1) repeats
MKSRFHYKFGPLVLLLLGLLVSQIGCNGTAKKHSTRQKDVVDTAVATGDFTTLVTAIKGADLVETLKSEEPFTVLAPTDEAFSKLPSGTVENLLKPENKQKLSSILTYHVVPGKVMASEVVNLSHAKTVNGQSLMIKTSHGTVMVDNAKVIKTDIDCSNGVIHVIDTVLLPK